MFHRPFVLALLRVIPHLLLIAAVATLLLVFKQWAYVTTYRLYLDRRVGDGADSTATQRFDLEGTRVVPQILMRDDRVSFRAAIGQDSTIRVKVRPAGEASYEIHVRQGGTDRVAARGEVSEPTSVVCPFPTGNGVIELVSHGQLTWSDLRLQRDLQVTRELWVLGTLLACSLVWRRREPRSPTATPTRSSRGSRAWLATLTVLVSVAIATVIVEVALRAVGSRLSSGISAARRDLGELTEDPRWQQSPRYGPRLNSNVDAMNYWRYGDIVRMGFIPPGVSEGLVHRYALRTDAEGFRNHATRDDIEVAALGDSFTDALTMPIEAAWTTQLEQLIGLPVQNYGTAGFGPQQELLVLEDYAARHHPRVVVLAFFAGNDIRDAEAFERFEQAGGTVDRSKLGWPIKDVVSRADTWYLMSAIQAAAAVLQPAPPKDDTAPVGSRLPVPTASPSFDRGMFTVAGNGPALRWAFMPPYLNLLTFSERDLAARRGWALARQSLIAMQRVSRGVGAEFVLMFLPFKGQVYLPLLEQTFSRDGLARAFQFYLGDTLGPLDIERMSRNRLAQNTLMRRFCKEAGIPFLDVTEALQMRVEAGENMYFPDDSHLNEAGAAVVAASLAAFLQDRGLVSRSGVR
ncbi:MAG TPA: hypothetical protein VES67_06140 [Vicinamibacterales bacterium]|nr:hypothetical protein [Vicinamibacterales bacterium]